MIVTDQDNFLDRFIVDFYSSTSLKIKPIVGWSIIDSLSYDILTNNFCATIKIYDECIDGILHKYIDALISFQTDGGGIISCERKFYPRHGYYNAMARICRACGYICLPIEYLPVRLPPVCMNGLYYV